MSRKDIEKLRQLLQRRSLKWRCCHTAYADTHAAIRSINKAKIHPNTTLPNVEYLLNYSTLIIVGRTEKNILGKENASVMVDLLKKAYCDEMQIFHYFWYIGINMEGIGLVTYAPTLKTQATGELTHAELLSNRISELSEKAPSDPAIWKTQGNIGPLDPAQYLTLRAALEKGLEFEGKAVENYNLIAKKALEINDFVTYNLATTILANEVKDEQHTEDVLKNLEVK